MNTNYLKSVLIAFLLMLLSTQYAQSINPRWVNYTNGDYVFSIVEEGNYLWLGTNGGAIKYDKTTGEKIFFNKGNSLLITNLITSIAIEDNGDAWLGTPMGLTFKSGSDWQTYTSSNSPLPGNNINAIIIDNNLNKWIGTNNGLVKYNGTDWLIFNTSNSPLPSDIINTFKIDPASNLWIGTANGLVKYDGINWTVYNSSNSGLTRNNITSIEFGINNSVWVGVKISSYYDNGGGVFKFDGSSWSNYMPYNWPWNYSSITSLAVDSSNNVWIGAQKWSGETAGIFLLNTTSNTIAFYDTVPGAGLFPALFIDSLNVKWIGTNKGLVKHESSFYTKINTSNSGLTKNFLLGLCIDKFNNKWFVSFSDITLGVGPPVQMGSLVKFDGAEWTTYTYLNSPVSYSGALFCTADDIGNLWVSPGDYEHNILGKFDGTVWTTISLPSAAVSAYLFADIDSSIYLNTNDGLYKYKNNGWSIVAGIGHVNQMIRTGENLWFGSGNGLYKRNSSGLTQYTTANSGLPDNLIHCLAKDPSGNLWIGTENGLAKFDGAQWTVYNSSNSPLPDNNIKVIAIGSDNIIYLHTIASEALIKKEGDNWTFFDIYNSGLAGYPYSVPYPFPPYNYLSIEAIAVDTSNHVWLATNGGVAVYDKMGVPVPVELVSFTALIKTFGVELNWTTASETNNKGFQVECSIQNSKLKIKNFEPIGFVNGNGTSTELNYYSFKDETVSAGKYIYRLKQIDYDRSFEYSNEIEVEIGVPDEFALYQNYPNPFNPTTKIRYSIPSVETHRHASQQNILLKIYDVLGTEIATLVNEEKAQGEYVVEFDGSGLASGVYFYQLRAGSFVQTNKMVLMR